MRGTTKELGELMAAELRHAELHNTVGLGIVWLLRYLRDNPSGPGSQDLERRGFARRAGQVWSIRDLVKSAEAGVYKFQAQNRSLLFKFAGDVELQALDAMLELAHDLADIENLKVAMQEGPKGPPLRTLLLDSGINVAWEEAPEKVRTRFRHRAKVLGHHLSRTKVPSSIRIGSFTFANALAVWQELLAAASYRHVCLMMGSQNPLVACPSAHPDELVDQLVPSGIEPERIAQVLDFLTFDIERDADPCLAPIIPIGDNLAPISALITAGAPDRNLLARLRADPSRYGKFAKEIGRIGTLTVAEALSRVPGTLLSKEIKVWDREGKSAGDLDVVSIDPRGHLIAIFEVKWQLEPDGASEVDKVEIQAAQGQAQLGRMATGLSDGSLHVTWPAGYPDPSGYEWKWFVITSNVIPMVRGISTSILARSHRLLTYIALQRVATLREVCDLLASPPIPPTAAEDDLEPITRRFWDYEITVLAPG